MVAPRWPMKKEQPSHVMKDTLLRESDETGEPSVVVSNHDAFADAHGRSAVTRLLHTRRLRGYAPGIVLPRLVAFKRDNVLSFVQPIRPTSAVCPLYGYGVFSRREQHRRTQWLRSQRR